MDVQNISTVFAAILEYGDLFAWGIVWVFGAFTTWVLAYQSGGLPFLHLYIVFVLFWPWGLANVLVWYWASRYTTVPVADPRARFVSWFRAFVVRPASLPAASYLLLPATFPVICARWLRFEKRTTA
jgi:hypothetical protein